MKVLVIAPHPDDEVLGCGATIAKLTQEGHQVSILVVSKGDPKLYADQRIVAVRNEAKAAHKILGVSSTYFLDFHAPNLDKYSLAEISVGIKKYINLVQADTLYIPHRGDIHNDHTIVFKASLVAARPVGNYFVKTIYSYETLSETEWAAPFGDDVFIPTAYEDISDFFEKKIEAMSCFKSQLKEFPNPRSIENLEALAKFRGATVGLLKAEAFSLIRTIR